MKNDGNRWGVGVCHFLQNKMCKLMCTYGRADGGSRLGERLKKGDGSAQNRGKLCGNREKH